MKVSYSIFAILLSIFCIMYLLFYPQQNPALLHSLSAKALAKETDSQNEHNTLASALALSMDTTYRERIAANDLRYYYISFRKNTQISFATTSFSSLKISLSTDTGEKISYNTQSSGSTWTLTPSVQSFNKTRRIFICLTNKSVQPVTLDIQVFSTNSRSDIHSSQKNSPSPRPTKGKTYQKKRKSFAIIKPDNKTISNPNSNSTSKPHNKAISNPNSNATSKPHNKTISNSDNNTVSKSDNKVFPETGKKTKSKSFTKSIEAAVLYPQFLSMKPDSKAKLHLKQTKDTSNFVWLSSNPLAATVSDGEVRAVKEGIAIIYVCERNNPDNATSCFVRVIEGT